MPGDEPLARGWVRTCLDMTSGEDRPLPRALVIRRTWGQAVERTGGSRRPSCRGARRPPSTLGARATCPAETHNTCRARELRRDTPSSSTRPVGTTRMEEENRDPGDLSLVNATPTPWHIKGKGRTPVGGTGFTTLTHPHNTSRPETWEPVPSLDCL
jgi:hypothetical protein